MANDQDPFAEEPTLPQLPAWSHDTAEPDAYSRKRAYPFKASGTDTAPSSDIGVFSSDDDPALDNYVRARQKRRYRGTWYDHNRMMSDPSQNDDDSNEDIVPETPRAKVRNSGSQENGAKGIARAHSGGGHPPPTPPSSNPLQSQVFTPNRGFPSSQVLSPGKTLSSSQGIASSQGYSTEPARKQLAVRQAIESRIDRGESVIDLTNLGLDNDSISIDTFRPLVELRLVPRVQLHTPARHSRDPLTTSKDGYLHRESKIVLIMANNRLTRVPGTLFDIENLVDLSLRHNKLTELPPAVAKCRNLRSLNLSFNRLRYLPFELVERLPMLDTLNLVGNDFYEPEPSSTKGWLRDLKPLPISELPDYLKVRFLRNVQQVGEHDEPSIKCLVAWYLGRGAVQYTDTVGRIYSSFRVPLAGGERNQILTQEHDEQIGPLARCQGESQSRIGSNQGISRVPSLVELCARSLARSGRPEDFADLATEADILSTAITAAAKSRYDDGQQCAVCKKFFVIPRTQWIEFFYHDRGIFGGLGREQTPSQISADLTSIPSRDKILENLIPCLRTGCSWKCIPYQTGLRSGHRVRLNF